jgi:hypothetical protein
MRSQNRKIEMAAPENRQKPQRCPHFRLAAIFGMMMGALLQSIHAQPANDNFTNRIVLVGTNISITASNIGATKEAGEPNHGGKTGGASVWWTWTAPLSGRVVTTVKSDFDTLLAVYVGTDVAGLTNVAGSESYTPLGVAFNAVAGTAYQIAVDGNYDASDTFTMTLQYASGPPNDNFADRIALTNTDLNVWYVTGTDAGATKELGETPTGYESVWWTWTAPTNGEALIDLESLGYTGQMTYPWLTVYTGASISNLNQTYPRVDFGRNSTLDIGRFPVTAGTTYQIWVATAGTVGNYYLRLTFEPPPPNDNFSNRITITNTSSLFQYGDLAVSGYNVSATVEPGEPSHCGQNCYFGGKSVWWSWTSPANARVNLGPNPIRLVFTSMVGVYTGNTVSNLTRVTNAYSTCTSGASSVIFNATAGTTYQIAVDGGGGYGDSGEFALDLYMMDTNPPTVAITNPCNGQCFATSNITLAGTAADVGGTNEYISGILEVDARINGGPWIDVGWASTWSTPIFTLARGVNTLDARSRDVSGNYSTNASITVTYGTIIAPCVDGAGIHFTFPSETNQTYQLEWAASLAAPIVWQAVNGAATNGCGSPVTLSDTNCPGQSQRFYRLRATGP